VEEGSLAGFVGPLCSEEHVMAKRKYTKEEKERVDKDIRPTTTYTWFKNFDYTDEGPNETSLGGGLYHGSMDKYKSVKDFLDKRRKALKERKKKYKDANKRFGNLIKLAKRLDEEEG
jgi:hypothetical protein